ncbi:MAG TPA: hypothetical protein VF377_06580 [Acidimicrobiia bacterium]
METERPVLKSVDLHLDDVVTVSVTLAAGDGTRVGTAEGSIDPAARARVVGEATLRALESLIGEAKFELVAVGTTTMDNMTVALVQVKETENGERYIGSALVRQGDAVLATARAVLDALNRRLAAIA